MSKMWIVQGDITSSGGKVITGSPFTDIDGKPVARITDKATCPSHKGVFPIVDGDPTIVIDGQPVALHGSKLACGCSVLSVSQLSVFVDQAGAAGSPRSSADAKAAACVVTPHAAAAPTPSDLQAANDKYDEAFVLRSEETDEPLAGRRYRIIRESGAIEEGTTDTDGQTHVVKTPTPELLKIELVEESA